MCATVWMSERCVRGPLCFDARRFHGLVAVVGGVIDSSHPREQIGWPECFWGESWVCFICACATVCLCGAVFLFDFLFVV
eukprot:GDKH01011586.1.p2 GENE.GDKH01011586.1~~GDKH01011586.1.p2  ORF type:complete len:80 (-),score=0.13 GDKH01011586.1:32-271(-)